MSDNWFYTQVWNYLRWSIAIYKKLAAIVPGDSLSIVGASLLAQISLLFAFFLPLKIVLLIASPGIPRYFPSFFAEYNQEHLTVLLAMSAIGFYVLYLTATRFMESRCERGAERILMSSRKLHLFARQEELARLAYRRISISTAALLFSVLSVGVITLLYASLGAFLIGLLLLFILVISVITDRSSSHRIWFTENASDITDILSAVFFLSAFSFIIVDFILGNEINIISAIIALLLSRRSSTQIASVVGDAITLSRQRPRINALFFHNKSLVHTREHEYGFWSLLEKKHRQEWLRETLEDVIEHPVMTVESDWNQIGPPGVAGLDVSIDTQKERFFVKLFSARQRAQAMQETILLGDRLMNDLPAPSLLAATSVEDFECLVFSGIPSIRPDRRQAQKLIRDLRVRCWSVEPSSALVNRYCRSKPLIYDRFDNELLYRLRIVYNTQEQERLVELFSSAMNDIVNIISELPLSIYNPDINIHNIRMNNEANPEAICWGRWSLEPIGAGWPIAWPQLKAIGEHLSQAADKNRNLSSISMDKVMLSALMFSFDRFCIQENYSEAIDILPNILTCFDNISSNASEGNDAITANS